MSDMQCPYCNADQEVCHDDGRGYSEDEKHEHQCTKCDKMFVFRTIISFDYLPSKADCLNGDNHKLIFRQSWPQVHSRMGCRDCDFERTAAQDEIEIGLRSKMNSFKIKKVMK